MATAEPESVVIDVWTAPSGRQEEVIDRLRVLFEQFQNMAGFIDGRVHASLDGTKVVSYSRMRSAVDRQDAEQQEQICEQLQALESIARPHRDDYELAWVFSPPPEPGPVTASYGQV
jgi:hypothetical protein